jgi:hypothetical protein
MQRVCSYCRKVFGEKCGKCGSENVELQNGRGGARWLCLICKAAWRPGSQPQTHGVCPDCETAITSRRAA